MTTTLTIPLFPLGRVLFSGGYLPLHIFEPRYVRMIKECQESGTGFGVVLIKEGDEVRRTEGQSRPEFHSVGTLADLIHVDKLPDDRYSVVAKGGAKFTVESTWEDHDHLLMGDVSFFSDETAIELSKSDEDLVTLLKFLLERNNLPQEVEKEIDFSDARDVSLRLANLMPVDEEAKQTMLQMDSPRLRIAEIRRWVLS